MKNTINCILSNIKENDILVCVLPNIIDSSIHVTNNKLFLNTAIKAVIYETDLKKQEFNLSKISFLENKDRIFIISIANSKLIEELNKIFKNKSIYSKNIVLGQSNLYDILIPAFNNWYFKPQIHIHGIKQHLVQNAYIGLDTCSFTGPSMVKLLDVDDNELIKQYMAYLDITPNSKLNHIWYIEYEHMLLTFIDNQVEYVLYFQRY